MNSLFVVFFLLTSPSRAADSCAPRSCAKLTDRAVCIAGPRAPEDIKEAKMLRGACGDTETIRVSGKADLQAALKKLAADCVQIERLTISSEGMPGSSTLDQTPMNVASVGDQLGGFRCLMRANATVQFLGSLTGNGCRGEDYLREVAKQILPQGGVVAARRGMRNPVNDAYWQDTNNRFLSLTWNPSSSPKEKWTDESAGNASAAAYPVTSQKCADEIKSSVEKYSAMAEGAKAKSCKVADQTAVLAKAKDLQVDFSSRKIPDNRFESAYSSYDLYYVLANLDRASYDLVTQCGAEVPKGPATNGIR